MSLRPSRNASGLSIRPPSPHSIAPPALHTPTNQMSSATALSSPRRTPVSPSASIQTPQSAHPSQPSNTSYYSQPRVSAGPSWDTGAIASQSQPQLILLGGESRLRGHTLDVPGYVKSGAGLISSFGSRASLSGGGSNSPGPGSKRLPVPAWTLGPSSPLRRREGGSGVGAYDNKLVSSTLSHLPPLPSPTGTTSPRTPQFNLPLGLKASTSSARPSLSHSSSSGVVILPDGTTLSTTDEARSSQSSQLSRSMADALAHSSPNSPWSLLTVHVLPLFAGSPLKTPIEDLNQLCLHHLTMAAQRVPASRLIASLTADLRDFIASGMLTLKAKLETLEDAKVVTRTAEVWSFFWAQVLPYLEAVFLPLTQIRDVHTTSRPPTAIVAPPIPVRHLLLSGFMLHILLPILPRLIALISNSEPIPPLPDLQRTLQMSLILSTQARYSSIFPTSEKRDDEVRENVEDLGRTVRWVMTAEEGDDYEAQERQRIQRGASMTERRKGRRASTAGREWGTGEVDDDVTPSQSYAVSQGDWLVA